MNLPYFTGCKRDSRTFLLSDSQVSIHVPYNKVELAHQVMSGPSGKTETIFLLPKKMMEDGRVKLSGSFLYFVSYKRKL